MITRDEAIRLNTINAYTAQLRTDGQGSLADLYLVCCHDRELDAEQAKMAGEYLLANGDEIFESSIAPILDEICEAGGLRW